MSETREAKTRRCLCEQGEAKARRARLRARAAADALTPVHYGGRNEAAVGSGVAAADSTSVRPYAASHGGRTASGAAQK